MEVRPMHRLIATLPLSLVLTLSGQTADRAPKIAVRLYNFAQLSEQILARAEQEAVRIYGLAGLEVTWVHCPFSLEEHAQYRACHYPESIPELDLRILPRTLAVRLHRNPLEYGFAQFAKDGRPGALACVFAHRAEELAQGDESFQGVIQGHLIAHELGHLLLGIGSHSASGIMHVPWNSKELERVRQGTLFFPSWQAKRIRAQVRKLEQGANGAVASVR